MLGGNRMNDRFWRETLSNVAKAIGRRGPAWSTPRSSASTSDRQWRHARNVRNSATLRTARHTLTAPVRWISRKG